MIELRGQRLHEYTGNYDDFLVEREARKSQQQAAFKSQQREIAHLQTFVDRFGAKSSMASRAKSKEKQIARLEEAAIDEPEDDLKKIQFRFPQPPRSGLKVIKMAHVEQSYGEHVVYQDLNFECERGQRTVLVGPNGAGKSTLLKILAGVIPINGGVREVGGNVITGYFAQNRVDNLNPKLTVLENVMELRTTENGLTEQQARGMLGTFLFRKDDVNKRVSVLSGGEKSRLALVKLMINPPNFLLMDEPTTHLDIMSIDALIAALKTYEGTLYFVSHDVHFIREIAKTVLHVHSGRLTQYAGDYAYYLEKSKSGNERAALTAGFTDARPKQLETPKADKPKAIVKPSSSDIRKLKAEVAKLEQTVTELEAKQTQITAELADPATYTQGINVQQLNARLRDTINALQTATAAWEQAAQKLSEAEGA
jgi:ATP-binding cassette subfamily F protein 3